MSSNNSSTQNEQAKKVVEDGPKMRSVAMLSPSAMPLMPRMTPLVKESSPSYSMPAKAAPSPVINTKSIQQFYSHVQSFPSMPHAYFLERTHVAIAHATPNEIAQRVATCLQKQSVAATYHNHEVRVCDRVQGGRVYRGGTHDPVPVFFVGSNLTPFHLCPLFVHGCRGSIF